jgi:hypothetical protein
LRQGSFGFAANFTIVRRMPASQERATDAARSREPSYARRASKVVAMSIAGFIGLTLSVFGVFVAVWFARELRLNLRTQTAQTMDGSIITRSRDERRFWLNIWLYLGLALWGALWAIVGLAEYMSAGR